jgi:2'-5' RNA ligase
MKSHQDYQKEVINKLEQQVKSNSLSVSTVAAIGDFQNDPRICLTSVHFPNKSLIKKITETILNPLRKIQPEHFYYPDNLIHITIKNVRVINNPPHFSPTDIEKVKKVFDEIIPKHKQFKIYYYRLLLFPANLTLIGTTDPELDNIILKLDSELLKVGVPDDKKYVNDKYFFSNVTLARFLKPVSDEFRRKVEDLSSRILFDPYITDSVSLVTANAVMQKRNVLGNWILR